MEQVIATKEELIKMGYYQVIEQKDKEIERLKKQLESEINENQKLFKTILQQDNKIFKLIEELTEENSYYKIKLQELKGSDKE